MRKQNTEAGKNQPINPKIATRAHRENGTDKFFGAWIAGEHSTLKASFFITICLATLLLASCGGESGYPSGWPALEDKLHLSLPGHNCPDMRGIYEFDSMQHDNSTFDIRSTFMGVGMDEKDGARWSTITIAGDTATTLAITFQGGRTSPEDGNLRPVTKRVSVQRGVEYKCDGGWVVGKPQAMFVKSTSLNYERGDERYGLRPKGLQTTQLRRASEGSMVARADVRETREINFGPGTIGIPYWVDVIPYWARWDNYDDLSAPKISPQVTARIQREEYEKENGVSAPTSAVPSASFVANPNPKPKPIAPVLIEEPSKPVTGQDLQTLVQNISEGASLEGVTRQGDRIVARIHFTDRAQIANTIKNLSEASAFSEIQLHGTIAGANRNGIATISMKQR